MDRVEALSLLGLEEGSGLIEIEAAHSVKAESLQGRIDGAPTEALKAKYQTQLTELSCTGCAVGSFPR